MDIKERMNYIGGTDAAGILGMSRWKTPLSVWSEKTGLIEPEDISNKLPVKLGIRLEDVVSELFEEETGKKLQRKNATIFHPKYPFIAANIDRRVVGEDAIFEAKTASGFKAKEWEDDEIPIDYIFQCLHYLAVTGASTAYIAVLIGGNQQFIWKKIDRDEKLLADIISKEVNFWKNFVEPKIMPMDIRYGDSDILQKLYPHAKPGVEVVLTDEANAIIESLDALKQDKRAVETQIEKLKNRLKAMVKENELGLTNLYRVTWKDVHKDAYEVKEQNYRQLLWKELK